MRRRFGRGSDAADAERAAAARREAELAALAEAVADEHCPGTGRVEPAVIACTKGITTSLNDYGDAFDGMLECRAGRFHIYCNRTRGGDGDSARTRFTMAHELGHYYIDEHRRALAAGRVAPHLSRCEHECALRVEREADLFAANLLMPAKRFRRAAKGVAPGMAGLITLAERFGVSLSAAAIRYAALDIAPCAVVKWDWHGRAWKHVSASGLRPFCRDMFELPDQLAEDSPTRRALAREPTPEQGFFQAGTVAAAWFADVEQGEWRDAVFVEEAVPLGRYGVLSLLYPSA